MRDLGSILAKYRHEKGLSLADLAAMTGISSAHLSAIESGLRGPSAETVVLLTGLQMVPKAVWIPVYLRSETRVATLCRMVKALLDVEDLTSAEMVLRQARSLNRAHFNGRYSTQIADLYGKLSYRQGRYRRSSAWFHRAEKGSHHRSDPVERAKSLYNLGQALARINRAFEACRRFDDAALIFRQHHCQRELGQTLLAKANVLMLQSGCHQEARGVYGKSAHLLRGDPLHTDALLGKVIARWYLTSAEGVYAELSGLLSKSTDAYHLAKAHHNLGVALRQMGRPQEAIGHLKQALAYHHGSRPEAVTGTLAKMCLCYLRLGDRTRAKRSHVRASSLPGGKDPQDVAALQVMGAVLGQRRPNWSAQGRFCDDYEMRLSGALELLQWAALRREGL